MIEPLSMNDEWNSSAIVVKINEVIDQVNHVTQDIGRLYANDHIATLNAEKGERCPICGMTDHKREWHLGKPSAGEDEKFNILTKQYEVLLKQNGELLEQVDDLLKGRTGT